MRKQILIVDDEIDIAEILAEALEPNFNVKMCAVPTEVMQLIEERYYNLVICDLHMPGMSGLEVMRSIRAQDPTLPVLVITGNSENSQDAKVALQEGACGVLVKPLPPIEDIVARVHKVARVQEGGA